MLPHPSFNRLPTAIHLLEVNKESIWYGNMTYWPDTENNQHLTCRNSILSFRQAFKSLAVSNLVNRVKDLFFVPSYFPSIPSPCLLSPSFHTCCSACSLAPVALYFLPPFLSSSSPYLTAQLFFHLLWTLQTFLRFRGSYEYLQLGKKEKKRGGGGWEKLECLLEKGFLWHISKINLLSLWLNTAIRVPRHGSLKTAEDRVACIWIQWPNFKGTRNSSLEPQYDSSVTWLHQVGAQMNQLAII